MKFFLMFVALAALWGGGQGIYTSMKNPSPTVYDLNDLSFELPKEEWLTLQNCDLSILDAAHFESAFGDGLAKEIYAFIF